MKQLVFGIIVIATLGIIGFAVLSMSKDDAPSQNTTSAVTSLAPESQATQPSEELPEFTKEEVATHDNRNDCWTIIEGNVYDVTTFISSHPGGSEILRACGIDATTLFRHRTTEDGQQVGTGTPHSGSAASQLAKLQIGTLAQ